MAGGALLALCATIAAVVLLAGGRPAAGRRRRPCGGAAEHHRPAHRRPGVALDAGDEDRRQGAEAQGRDDEALLRQLPALLSRRARRCSPASTRTTTRCSRTRRPTAATASSTSCTATTTCRCGCRRPAIRPPTSASTRTATPSPTSTGPRPPTCPRAGTTGTCSRRRAPSTSTTRSTRTASCASTPTPRRTTAPTSSPRRRSASSAPTRKASTPFYLELGYAAPHGGGGGDPGRSCNRAAVPAPRDLGTLKKKAKGSLPPSFNEADISDKPSPIADKQPLTDGSDLRHAAQAPLRLGVAARVDDSVGTLINELQRDGIRKNTYVFFLSDNGFMRGEHRIRDNKRFLYEESARVPFVARGPGIPHGESSNDVVVNADLTSTILQLSGRRPGLTQDGQSLMPSLTNPDLETRPGDPARGLRRDADPRRAHLALPLHRVGGHGHGRSPSSELYDMYADPYQLNNLANVPGLRSRWSPASDELDQLIDCAGADCRAAPTGQLTFTTGGGKAAARCRRSSRTSPPPTTAASSASRSAPARPRWATTPCRRSRSRSPTQALRDELPERGDRDGQGAVRRRPATRAFCQPPRVQQVTRRAAVAAAIALATAALALVSGCGGGEEPNPRDHAGPRVRRAAEHRLRLHRRPGLLVVSAADHAPHVQRDRRPRDHASPTTTTRPRSAVPARAGVLTGQYGHNNGVLANKPGYGDLADNENTLPVWLQRAGYQTAIAGQVPERLRERGRRQGRRRPGLGPVVGRDRQRPRLLRLQARRQRPPAQGDLQGPVPDRRDQPAGGRGRPPAGRRAARSSSG